MSRMRTILVLGFFVSLVGFIGVSSDLVHELEENFGLGLLFRLRGIKAPPPGVVIVSIDRESSKYLGVSENPDRWRRSLHAELINKLSREGARVITFDMYFVDPRLVQDDESLAEAIRRSGKVVLAEELKAKDITGPGHPGMRLADHRLVEAVKPIFRVAKHAAATAPFVLPRLPVKVHQYWTFQSAAGDSPTFPVVALHLYALEAYDEFFRILQKVDTTAAQKLPEGGLTAIQSRGTIRFIRDIRSIFEGDPTLMPRMYAELKTGDLVSRSARHSMLTSLIGMYGGTDHRYLNYYGPPRTVMTVPFYKVLQDHEQVRDQPPMSFKDKAVFVGLSEIELTERRDSFYTVFSRADGVFLSGTEIAATAFANLLENTPVSPVLPTKLFVLILLWGLLVAAIGRLTSITTAALGIIATGVVYLTAAGYRFQLDGTWYPVIVPLFLQSPAGFLGALLWNYLESNKERQNIRKALGYYVPDEVVNQLAGNRADIRRQGQTLYGSCLFTDCAGYTTVSERMPARDLNEFMQRYFAVIFEPIKRTGGLVVDLKGDAVLAVWRGSKSDAEPCRQACLAAVEIARAVRRFNEALDHFSLPTRIGLHAGEMFLGNIGAAEHYQYGVTGDTINTVARMDNLNKYLGTQILASAQVIEGVKDFATREVGSFLLKGKVQPIRIFELLGRMDEVQQWQKHACEIFARGLHAFRCGSWSSASEYFQKAAELFRNDELSSFYLKLCSRYTTAPPGKDWDGIVAMEDK